MFQNAIEKISKFYELDLNKNTHADEMFDILSEIIRFDSAAIFYLTPNDLSLEFGKNIEIYEKIKLTKNISEYLYNQENLDISEKIKPLIGITDSDTLCSRLETKGTIFGILIITRNNSNFSIDEKIIFKTCSKIIANMIKDLELSKVIKMQAQTLQQNLIETNNACETIKKQNKQIKAAEKTQNKFIANISHDLRTPLNSIIGFSEILSNKFFGNLTEKQSKYIEDIRVSAIRLLGMINEILDISKLESNTVKLNISEIDITMLINEVCNILAPLCGKKRLKINKQFQIDYPVFGDYIKLQQVMFNIIGNAIKFSLPDSVITIEISQNKTQTTIKIKDTGIGIDKRYHKKIFNKFFQVEDSLTKTEASTGLGLTIAKEFVKLHHGKIEVESEKSKGTTFTIIIPNMNDC